MIYSLSRAWSRLQQEFHVYCSTTQKHVTSFGFSIVFFCSLAPRLIESNITFKTTVVEDTHLTLAVIPFKVGANNSNFFAITNTWEKIYHSCSAYNSLRLATKRLVVNSIHSQLFSFFESLEAKANLNPDTNIYKLQHAVADWQHNQQVCVSASVRLLTPWVNICGFPDSIIFSISSFVVVFPAKTNVTTQLLHLTRYYVSYEQPNRYKLFKSRSCLPRRNSLLVPLKKFHKTINELKQKQADSNLDIFCCWHKRGVQVSIVCLESKPKHSPMRWLYSSKEHIS